MALNGLFWSLSLVVFLVLIQTKPSREKWFGVDPGAYQFEKRNERSKKLDRSGTLDDVGSKLIAKTGTVKLKGDNHKDLKKLKIESSRVSKDFQISTKKEKKQLKKKRKRINIEVDEVQPIHIRVKKIEPIKIEIEKQLSGIHTRVKKVESTREVMEEDLKTTSQESLTTDTKILNTKQSNPRYTTDLTEQSIEHFTDQFKQKYTEDGAKAKIPIKIPKATKQHFAFPTDPTNPTRKYLNKNTNVWNGKTFESKEIYDKATTKSAERQFTDEQGQSPTQSTTTLQSPTIPVSKISKDFKDEKPVIYLNPNSGEMKGTKERRKHDGNEISNLQMSLYGYCGGRKLKQTFTAPGCENMTVETLVCGGICQAPIQTFHSIQDIERAFETCKYCGSLEYEEKLVFMQCYKGAEKRRRWKIEVRKMYVPKTCGCIQESCYKMNKVSSEEKWDV